jgi:hypothetical protein
VQVFQNEDQGTPRRQHFQGFRQLPQHTGLGHATQRASKRLPFCRREQRRHLHKPARDILPQERHEVVRLRSPTQTRQGFQDGEVGFPSAIVVNALAMADPDMLRRGQRRDKAGNQGSFANTGFTANKRYLSFLLEYLCEPLVYLRNFSLAPDKDPRQSDDGEL